MKLLVIGAGVVGLAVARAAAIAGHDVLVAEAESAIGTGISSRNSEVIHAGLYYPTGSLRARSCVAGRRALYAYCESHGVGARKCGKLVVATHSDRVEALEALARQGRDNGVEGLRLIDGRVARTLEPALSCVAALASPETGIIDGHGLMLALRGDLEDAGGMIAFCAPIERIEAAAPGWRVRFGGREPCADAFDGVLNCAGLQARSVALACDAYPAQRAPRLVLAKGNYFAYARRPIFRRLIYPLPVEGGLGVHATLDLAGRMRFGPDVEWIAHEDYRVDPRRADAFYASIRAYWPGLEDGSLAPDYCGVRPKLTGPGEPPADFMIDGPRQHGLPGLIHFFGVESPGLTAALSLALDAARDIAL